MPLKSRLANVNVHLKFIHFLVYGSLIMKSPSHEAKYISSTNVINIIVSENWSRYLFFSIV